MRIRSKAGIQKTATAWGNPAREVVCLFYIRFLSTRWIFQQPWQGWDGLFTMSKVKSPTEKKRLSLLRDRRNMYGECPTSSRKNISRGPVPGSSAISTFSFHGSQWGLLSGMILVSFVASSLLRGKDPFAPGATKTGAARRCCRGTHIRSTLPVVYAVVVPALRRVLEGRGTGGSAV